MKKCYIPKNFTQRSQTRLALANGILEEYEADGYDLSLRQLYYQLVARGYIENSQRSYKRLGGLISDARNAGLIDWDMIVDRGRVTVSNSHWESPADILDTAARSFMVDRWLDQPNYVALMVEKQALEGVLLPTCRTWDISFMANKGYSSSSAMHEEGQTMRYRRRYHDKDLHLLYLGDHDPSGMDMTRDIDERLCMYSESYVKVHRLALNYDQVEALNPPENPAKQTDSRYWEYSQEYGDASWELDAVEPRMLVEIVEVAIKDLLDEQLWVDAVERETEMKERLVEMAQEFRAGEDEDSDAE